MKVIIDRSELYHCMSKDFSLDISLQEIQPSKQSLFEELCTQPKVTSADASNYLMLSQLSALISKRDDGTLDEVHISESIESLLSVNADMAVLNRERPWRKESWFEAAKHIAYGLLPPIDFSSEDMFKLCTFGPGATVEGRGVKGRHLLSKIGGCQTVTPQGIVTIGKIIQDHFPNWYENLKTLPTKCVPGNRISFVPKDYRKVRRIGIEPSLNMFVQLGVGKFIQRALLRSGIDLTDQQTNRDQARQGSVDGELATIDLSDASDRICISLVEDLLPPEWYTLLSILRSPRGLLPDGSHITYENFVSQGNGFTFPLETLIFYSCIRAATKTKLTVYGDDIIVPTKVARATIDCLTSIGAKVNEEKSFISGPFRESCGGDYISGFDVRPIFYKTDCTSPADVACLHNLLLWRYGNKIPLTLEYLRSKVLDPIFGPPQLYSTDKEDPLSTKNTISPHWRSWFWDYIPIGESPSRRYVDRPCRIKVRSTNLSKYLAFLYGGSRILQTGSLTRFCVAKFKCNTERVVNRLPIDPYRVNYWS